jgi:hypothetical protein
MGFSFGALQAIEALGYIVDRGREPRLSGQAVATSAHGYAKQWPSRTPDT